MDDVVLSRDLTALGYSTQELGRMSRSGELHRIRRGAYLADKPPPTDAGEAHRQLIEATVRQASPSCVVSHLSAAVLHELPLWDDLLDRVHLTRDRVTGAKLRRYSQLHVEALADDEITRVDGIPVTTVACTAVDLGRSLPFLRSVPIGDAALAAGLKRADLAGAVDRAEGRRGIAAARRMLDFCDGRSESVGESTSRVVLRDAGVPAPELQYKVYDGTALMARVDFCWEEANTIGEFDGRVKYGRLLLPGQSAGDAVYEEKMREDMLRDLGWQVVRWIWSDLRHPRLITDRLNRAFVRGRRERR